MGTKEKFIQVLEADPLADKNIQMTLPMISYSLLGLKYASNRKQQTTIQNYTQTSTGVATQYMPVPYDFNFEVSIYVRNIEDGTQIIEQILPFFTPDYTLRLQLIPLMNITKDIPIILNDTHYEIDSTGDHLSETRKVIWTLNFTVQGWLFGPVDANAHGLITQAIVNIYDTDNLTGTNILLVTGLGNGIFLQGETVYQGPTIETAQATAIVNYWSANTNRLTINYPSGKFLTNTIVYGNQSGAQYNLINYELIPAPCETITVTATDANLSHHIYTSNTVITTNF